MRLKYSFLSRLWGRSGEQRRAEAIAREVVAQLGLAGEWPTFEGKLDGRPFALRLFLSPPVEWGDRGGRHRPHIEMTLSGLRAGPEAEFLISRKGTHHPVSAGIRVPRELPFEDPRIDPWLVYAAADPVGFRGRFARPFRDVLANLSTEVDLGYDSNGWLVARYSGPFRPLAAALRAVLQLAGLLAMLAVELEKGP